MSPRPRVPAALALVLALAAGAAAAEPACRADARVEPADAVAGQQVLYRVRIASRDDVERVEWEQAPAFERLRTESLPGDPQPAAAEPLPGYRVREERRALFADAAGTYRLEAPSLRCALRDGAEEIAPVPAATLVVSAPPSEGRPDDYRGLIGPVGIHVTVTPHALPLGRSVRVAVMLRGQGNLWAAPPPFSAESFPGSELFAQRPKVVFDRGRRLTLRRHFAYDVVPRQAGTLRIPALAVPYFDPASGRYAVARADAVDVAVAPRAPDLRAEASRPDAARGARAPAPAPGWRARVGIGIAVLLPALGAAAWLWRRRARQRGGWNAASPDAADDDAARLERALRRALARHVTDAASVTSQELLARDPQRAEVASAAHLLAALERSRFDPHAPPPDPDAVRRAIAAL